MAVALAPHVLVNCVAPGLLEGTRATANLPQAQIDQSAAAALLKKAADKDDCADQVVTMCRTETMTGQTVVIELPGAISTELDRAAFSRQSRIEFRAAIRAGSPP